MLAHSNRLGVWDIRCEGQLKAELTGQLLQQLHAAGHGVDQSYWVDAPVAPVQLLPNVVAVGQHLLHVCWSSVSSSPYVDTPDI